MNRSLLFFFIIVITVSTFTSGCAHYSTDMAALTATSIKDLEEARSSGITREFALTKEEAYSKFIDIAKEKGLVVYQKNIKRGVIVIMNFPKQSNTTRVGIFLEPNGDNKTTVTLSSLSITALQKAEMIFFENE